MVLMDQIYQVSQVYIHFVVNCHVLRPKSGGHFMMC